MAEPFTMTDIPAQECWELLDAQRFGRLAVSVHGQPDIYPINFLVADGKILMKTASGTKLFQVTLNNAVALEADHVTDTEAWSIVLRGVARVVDSFSERYELDEWHLDTWLPSHKPVYITIEDVEMTGRRFVRDPSASSEDA